MRIKLMGVGLTTLLLSACGSDLDRVRGQFIDSCMSGGGIKKSECKCAIDKLQDHYGEEGLVAIDQGGYPPPDFVDQLVAASNLCRGR
ncbi:hypothetical protein [Stenotrophomonas sp.]|uniref:hypothetical protein n=1 Tax=Stenotrophomonas sp. TaxID=69392 RepID=UPI0028A6108B|nr:hypothetical protein [Stenotrophomonas sp.]